MNIGPEQLKQIIKSQYSLGMKPQLNWVATTSLTIAIF